MIANHDDTGQVLLIVLAIEKWYDGRKEMCRVSDNILIYVGEPSYFLCLQRRKSDEYLLDRMHDGLMDW